MEDLIKREDAIKALRCEYPTMPMFKGLREEWAIKTEGFRKAEEVIMSVPSADRPQGEWIRDRYWSRGVGMGEEYGFFYKCSMCEYEVESGYTRCGFNYCPYCGADMRGDRR